jgi:hypothetical protein
MIRVILLAIPLSFIYQGIAEAQKAFPPANGEAFVFEFRTTYWSPTLSSDLKVDNGNLAGTNINVVRDLGFDEKKPVPTAELTFKLAERHKLRLDYLSFAYSGNKTISTGISFNGVVYPLRSQLKTDMELRSIKAGYELDVFRSEKGYVAFRLAADSVYAKASIETLGAISNSASASIIAPVVGVSGRISPMPWGSLTADICGVGYEKSTVYDLSVYADMNPVKNLGITVGWRTLRLNINVEGKTSDTQWSGVFGGLALRF